MIEVGDMVRVREDQIYQPDWGLGIVVEIEPEFYRHPNQYERSPRIKVYWMTKKMESYEPVGGLKIISKITKKP